MMVALYLVLALSVLTLLGVAGAVYLRVKKKIGLPPTETQQIRKRDPQIAGPTTDQRG
jgi:hypothetical protein